MDCCTPEKRKLIEEIGVHFEKIHNLAPLSARIYIIMILSPNDGHTFDEIIEITQASKSSVSTQLNLLLQTKKVEYFTKSGDRKRYFRASRTYLKNTLNDEMNRTKEEIRVVDKIQEFNSTYNKEKFQRSGGVGRLYMDHLKLQKENLERTIEQMNQELEN